jgi:hypothetical protein
MAESLQSATVAEGDGEELVLEAVGLLVALLAELLGVAEWVGVGVGVGVGVVAATGWALPVARCQTQFRARSTSSATTTASTRRTQ